MQGKASQISGALKGSTSYAIKLNSQGTDTDRKAACRHRKCKDCGGASICAHHGKVPYGTQKKLCSVPTFPPHTLTDTPPPHTGFPMSAHVSRLRLFQRHVQRLVWVWVWVWDWVHWHVSPCVVVRLVHTSLRSSYLIAHVLHCPPPPTRTALYLLQ